MQNVSNDYKNSINQIGRNRGYIKVTIGIVNTEAQNTIKVKDTSVLTYYSNTNILRGDIVKNPYATCEEGWTKVDGSMYFLPTENSGIRLYPNGIVVDDINTQSIVFNFDSDESYDVAGFTIDFSDNYPIDFTISNGTETITITDNDSRYYTVAQGLHEITELTISATRMKNENSRLRIYQLSLGINNVFTNNELISYEQTDYVSAVSDTIPSNDTRITVANYDQYYNPDNDNSIFTFFEVGQEVKTQFGYDVNDDGNIEWLPETVTHLKTWSATDEDATFTATDIFDYVQGIYYGGDYYPDGISLADLAEDVLNDAGIDKYTIDSYLDDVIVNNPIPPVSHTEALQIIANAGRCALKEDRDGHIYLESGFIPTITVSCNGETEYSNIENVLNDDSKDSYAINSFGFAKLNDSKMNFVGTPTLETVGYVSSQISNANGAFTTNPTITLSLESAYKPFGLFIRFRNNAPKQFIVTTYLNDEIVNTFTVNNPSLEFNSNYAFSKFDTLVIEFTEGQGNDRVTVDKISFNAPTDYTIYRNMLKDSPTVTRDEKIKSISIEKQIYSESAEPIRELTVNDVVLGAETYTFYFSTPSYGYVASSDVGDCTIIDSSAYFVTVSIENTNAETATITIEGYEYAIDTQYYIVKHNNNGVTKEWSNPLISNNEQASLIEDWLADYFMGYVDYEFTWRGDPRVDANDLFYYELKTGEMVNIRSYSNTIFFDGAWSGSIKARKVVV